MPIITQEVEIEFSAFCTVCGQGICTNVEVMGDVLRIMPCEHCLEKAHYDVFREMSYAIEKLKMSVEEAVKYAEKQLR